MISKPQELIRLYEAQLRDSEKMSAEGGGVKLVKIRRDEEK